jgi:uncharacterized delta-60 repeat protein
MVYRQPMSRLRLSLAFLCAAVALVAAPAASAAPGDLDPTFGSGGRVGLLTGEEEVLVKGVAVQADSKVVLAGGEDPGEGPGNTIVVRLLANGELDPGFGQNGKATLTISGGSEARAVAVQPDGKIVVVGDAKPGATYDFMIARLNADGSPDGSFGGGDGIQVVPVGSEFDEAEAVAIGPGGHILATGRTDLAASKKGAGVVVLKSNGEPDPAFTGTGTLVVKASPDGYDEGAAIAERPDGRILVGDTTGAGAGNGFTLVQLTAAGLPDPEFGGGDGIVNTPIPGGGGAEGRLTDFLLLPDGGIVASGYGFELVGSPPAPESTSAAIAYEANGDLDETFGDAKSGIFSRRLGDGSEAGAIERTPSGQLLLAGDYTTSASALQALRLEPFGILDQTFGSGGQAVLPPDPPFDDYFQDAALDPEERLLVLSTKYVGGDKTTQMVTRILGDKQPAQPIAATVNQAPHARMKAVPKKVTAAALKGFKGTAADPDGNGLQKVQISVVRQIKGGPRKNRDARVASGIRCFAMKNAKGKFKRVKAVAGHCPQRWLTAKGKAKWSFKLKRRLPPGGYMVTARAVDGKGLAESKFSRRLHNRYTFRVGVG